MSFIDAPRFPERISFHAQAGPGFNTTVVSVESGAEYRNASWSLPLAIYDVSHAVRLPEQAKAVDAFFRVAQGRLNGFRFKDWTDFSVVSAEGVFVKLTSTTYQLYKRYSFGSGYSGTSTTSLAIATGSKTWTTQSGLSFKVGLRVRAASLADGANYMEGLVTSYSSTTLVLLVDTIGGSGTKTDWMIFAGASDRKISKPVRDITITGGSSPTVDYTTGVVSSASAPTSWAGEFDVPCRFDVDQLKAEILDKSGTDLIIGYQSIPIIELRL